MNNKSYGVFCAMLAAIFNSMIGIFSVNMIDMGIGTYSIAFYKCILSFIILTTWLVFSGQILQWWIIFRKYWWQMAIASFFGLFIMYFFETAAYSHEKVSVVVFLLLGSATITTFILNSILNRTKLSMHNIISCLFALLGLSLVFGFNGNVTSKTGLIFAIIAGFGYGTFIISSKKFNFGSGIIVVNSLMLFGTIYLSVPFIYTGIQVIPNIDSFIQLLLLALLPTVGGFWCTTKAISLLKGETVQLLELSEPLFSLLLSFIFLGQLLTMWQLVGGLCVTLSIFVHMKLDKK